MRGPTAGMVFQNPMTSLKNHIVHSQAALFATKESVDAALALYGLPPVNPSTWEMVNRHYAPMARKHPRLLNVLSQTSVSVSDLKWKHPVCDAFVRGAAGIGIPVNPDYNGETQAGVGTFQRAIDRGRRVSTAGNGDKADG